MNSIIHIAISSHNLMKKIVWTLDTQYLHYKFKCYNITNIKLERLQRWTVV